MPEETPNEDDIEAEMLRMMQDEVEGGGEEAAEQEGQTEEAGNQEDASVDDMLEQEMLRAMQQEDGSEEGGGAVMPFFGGPSSAPELEEGIERLAEIDVTVTVELGGNLIPIKDILSWQSDSIVELGAEEHEPVNVLVNGKLFARGEVVVVGDTFGVRIIELLNAPDESHF